MRVGIVDVQEERLLVGFEKRLRVLGVVGKVLPRKIAAGNLAPCRRETRIPD